jgi:hypothetical protein
MGTIAEDTDAATHASIKCGIKLMTRRGMVTGGTGVVRVLGETSMSPTIS